MIWTINRLRSATRWPVAMRRQIGIETNSFFTVGHSTRTIVEFGELLAESRVDLVVDVRSMPRSRTNPQFNGESLPAALAPWRIGYEHIAALGGLRGIARGSEPSPNSYWRVRGFRNYADYALTEPFAKGLAQLRELGSRHRCAIMCAEAVWWRVPPPHHFRLPARRGRTRHAYPWGRSCRGGQPDTRCCCAR